MSENPYVATTIYEDVSAPAGDTGAFYVVSRRKAAILYLATLGMYGFYWFYKQWAQYRDVQAYAPDAEKIRPVPRTIFSVFFTHALFRKIKALGADNPAVAAWNNTAHAWLYVVLTLASSALNRASFRSDGTSFVDALSFLILLPDVVVLLWAQKMVNLASGDPEGGANSTLTGANWAWIAVGAVLWLLILVGMLVPA